MGGQHDLDTQYITTQSISVSTYTLFIIQVIFKINTMLCMWNNLSPAIHTDGCYVFIELVEEKPTF